MDNPRGAYRRIIPVLDFCPVLTLCCASIPVTQLCLGARMDHLLCRLLSMSKIRRHGYIQDLVKGGKNEGRVGRIRAQHSTADELPIDLISSTLNNKLRGTTKG